MKKKKVKREIRQAFRAFYKNGFTNLADGIYRDILKRIDKIYK